MKNRIFHFIETRETKWLVLGSFSFGYAFYLGGIGFILIPIFGFILYHSPKEGYKKNGDKK